MSDVKLGFTKIRRRSGIVLEHVVNSAKKVMRKSTKFKTDVDRKQMASAKEEDLEDQQLKCVISRLTSLK